MKVLILAFDGLEYNLVEKWKLENLKQERYYKLEIPDECFKYSLTSRGELVHEPWTPFVWSSIVTGKLPVEIGLTEVNVQEWDNILLQKIRSLIVRLKLNKRMITRFLVNDKGKGLEKIGFRKKYFNLIEKSKYPTFFQNIDDTLPINIPLVFQLRSFKEEVNWKLKLKGEGIEEFLAEIWKEYRRVTSITLDAITANKWKLIMSYVRLLDTVGELQYGRFVKMHKAYMECNLYAGRVNELIGDDTALIILSDHGIEEMPNTKYGKHSDHAFFSINRDLLETPKNIIDIFPIVVGLTQ